ncbi:MAG TPA: hypothetical protein VEF90_04900 [Xanthobacteraceae bacterium]|nr:hypothetical protein [Xanthobacteraceae bacterium]
MVSLSGVDEPLAHGGDLSAARRLFADATEPFFDRSSGINPYPYPPPRLFSRLPDSAALERLAAMVAKAYGAPSSDIIRR